VTPALHQPVPVQPTGTVQHPNFSPTGRGSPAVQAALGICADDPFKIFQAIPLCCVRITCNQMTTLYSILSGSSTLFIFMYVCTLSKSNKIFFFDESYALVTGIPN
jgi:hypothetical protein